MNAYVDLLKRLWMETSPYTSPADLKAVVEVYASQFQGHDQHDSQEFFVCFCAAFLSSDHVPRSAPRRYEPDQQEAVHRISGVYFVQSGAIQRDVEFPPPAEPESHNRLVLRPDRDVRALYGVWRGISAASRSSLATSPLRAVQLPDASSPSGNDNRVHQRDARHVLGVPFDAINTRSRLRHLQKERKMLVSGQRSGQSLRRSAEPSRARELPLGYVRRARRIVEYSHEFVVRRSLARLSRYAITSS